MGAVIWIVVAIVVLAVIGLIAFAVVRRRRMSLQERFGPEYEREVAQRGERGAAEHLRAVADRRDRLDIRPLTSASRADYTSRWDGVQAGFVDQPGPALDEADRLVLDVMQECGYPIGDFEERAELVAADHPQVVEHYRAAQVGRQHHHEPGTSDTEELRAAFVHYRALFEHLVHDGEPGERRTPATR